MKSPRLPARGILPALVWALALPVLAADAPAPTPAVAPAGRILALKVTVVDAGTHQPVAGATVGSWEVHDVTKVITDAAGVATLSVPLDPPYAAQLTRCDVTVTAPGYVTRRAMWNASAGHARDTLPAEYQVQLSPGVTVGGVVRDEHGAPVSDAKVFLSGSDYRGATLGGDRKTHQDFSSIETGDADASVTEADGTWHREHFPAELSQLIIDVVRAGGARARFVTDARSRRPNDHSELLDLAAVKAGTAVLVLKDGVTVHGEVRDTAGRPLGGVQLRVRDANARVAPLVLPTDPAGKFELSHWNVAAVLVTAELPGYRTTSATFTAAGDTAAGRIVMTPAQPLRLRVLGENDAPIVGADVRTNPNFSDQILDWHATTDAEGRVTWPGASDAPTSFWISPKGYPFRSVKILADGEEHVIRLRPGADKAIRIHLKATDATTGAPVANFEVWRRMPNGRYQPWGEPATQGEFNRELAATEFPKGFVPVYRLQVRAAGYTGWSGDTFDFSDGDQDLALKLTPGESTVTSEPPAVMRPGEGVTGDTDPSLLALGAAVARLLQTGDVAGFTRAACASEQDWRKLTGTGEDEDSPLGSDPVKVIRRHTDAVAASATHILALAARAGITPGKMRFDVKFIGAPSVGSVEYARGTPRAVSVPQIPALRLVLAGEPVGAAGGQAVRGDFELALGTVLRLPAGWRTDEGVRWVSFPAGMADEALRREVRLAVRATPANFGDERTLSGADDPALLAFGTAVTELLRSRDVPRFLSAATLDRTQATAFFQHNGWGAAEEAAEFEDRLVPAATSAGAALLAFADKLGADFSDAKITVRQVLAERPHFTHYGELDGLRAEPVRVSFSVESTRTGRTGRPIAGNYAITFGDLVRTGDRWTLMEGKMRWQDFPKELMAEDEAQKVSFENYVAEHRTLPKGMAAPAIDLVPFDGSAAAPLSAYRGKVVILEFWASWCGPCQEPMEKLQHLADAHPAWKDRVEIIALSIDDTQKAATDHLAKKAWTHTTNRWAGKGGWEAPATVAFRVTGVPTAYVIDQSGNIVEAGHPMALDFGAIVDRQLAGK